MNDWRAGHVLLLGAAASAALTILLLLLTGCSGGGSPGEPQSVPQRARANPVLVSYYGECPTCIERTYGHVQLAWAMGWHRSRAETIAEAKQRGLKVVLYLPEAYTAPESLRLFFASLKAQDLLSSVAYLFPEDEPDIANKWRMAYTAAEITAANDTARTIAGEFGISPRVIVNYAGFDDFPGAESADVIGGDDYKAGTNVLSQMQRYKLKPGQSRMLVIGGVDPFRQDPRPFFAYACTDPDVEIITSFLYGPDFADDGLGLAIGSNGLAPAYEAAAGAPC